MLALLAVVAAGCAKEPVAPSISVPLSAIVVSPDVDTLNVGGTAQFTATALDTAGLPVSVSISWISGDTRIFTVGSLGRVQGVAEGTALLVAAAGGVRDSAQVTVLPGGGWVRQASATTADLNGVFFLPGGRTGWAVGDAGTILRTTDAGVTWTRQVSGTAFTLNGVWFIDDTDGWIAGMNGTVLVTSDAGLHWKRYANVGQSEALMDIQFATADTGWVVGASGLVLRTFDGGLTWGRFRVPTAFALESVSFANASDGWAVGGNGVIAGTHDAGVTWFITPPLTIQPLKAVWRRSEAVAFAVGGQGTTPRTFSAPDSSTWELKNAGSARQLEGVHYPGDAIGYAVGYDAGLGGLILRTDDGGTSWEVQPSNVAPRLNDVFFVDALRGWAVGQSGTIVHTGRGGKP